MISQKKINRETIEVKGSHDKLKSEAPVHKMKKMVQAGVQSPPKGGVHEFSFTPAKSLIIYNELSVYYITTKW